MSQTVYQQPPTDTTDDAVWSILKGAGIVLLVLLLLPLVVPVIAMAIAGEGVAVKARFWIAHRWQLPAAIVGVLLVIGLYVLEAALLIQWRATGGLHEFRTAPDWPAHLWPTFGPWLLVNLAAGVLLLPAAWSWQRRRIAERVRTRRISDVMRQTRIETARKRAADVTAAGKVGVQLDSATGQIRGTRADVVTVPRPVAGGGQAFGFVTTSTVRTIAERFYDTRQVRDWIDPSGKLTMLPHAASAVRVLLIAESGTGKTVLINGLVLCALEYGWPVFVLDAKGDPDDAAGLARLAESFGRTAVAGGKWNLFAGTADQVTAKLMRLMPPPDGANQHYLDEIRGVLQAVQHESPVRSVEDLRERLTSPARYVRDQYDLGMVTAPVDKQGTMTAGTRALQSLGVALRPLEPWLSDDGWTYDQPAADVTVVPISPVDDAQVRLGDLLMLDLRNFMATRLARGDKSPVLVIVDEFPQLVTGTSDPGDTAGSLFETARSAGVGLVLALQSPAGLSNDETRRRRALTSGAALIFGRTKDPEDVVKYAGTVMQMEASGAAGGEELRSARAQHTYVIPPQDVREATDGSFWLVQAGGIAPFRALPYRPVARPIVNVEPDELDGDEGAHGPAQSDQDGASERVEP